MPEEKQEEVKSEKYEIRSEAAEHCMLIEYSLGNRAQVDDAVDRVNKFWPGLFNFLLVTCPERGVNSVETLEVTVFAGSTDLAGEMTGTLVHSKRATGTYVEQEPVSFITYIERALENYQQNKRVQ